VDRVIRTIRDGVGQNYYDMRNINQVFAVVNWYNITPHKSLKFGGKLYTPEEVNSSKALEGIFIRRNLSRLEEINRRLRNGRYFDCEPGDVLLIHLDLSRTPLRFMKRRRVFNALAIFDRYVHGNVQCTIYRSGLGRLEIEEEPAEDAEDGSRLKVERLNLDEEEDGSIRSGMTVTIPIYCARWVADSIENVPEHILEYFS
jgi:hypothetical protein